MHTAALLYIHEQISISSPVGPPLREEQPLGSGAAPQRRPRSRRTHRGWRLSWAAKEEGETAFKDGETASEDGETAFKDGETVFYDGETVFYDGETVFYDGKTAFKDGETAVKDGETASEDGETASEDEFFLLTE